MLPRPRPASRRSLPPAACRPRARFPHDRTCLRAQTNLAGFMLVLSFRKNRDFAIMQLPGLNHLMQPAIRGLPIEYASISVTVSPLLLTTVSQWIAARMIR